jgi:hypothetical protein
MGNLRGMMYNQNSDGSLARDLDGVLTIVNWYCTNLGVEIPVKGDRKSNI